MTPILKIFTLDLQPLERVLQELRSGGVRVLLTALRAPCVLPFPVADAGLAASGPAGGAGDGSDEDVLAEAAEEESEILV